MVGIILKMNFNDNDDEDIVLDTDEELSELGALQELDNIIDIRTQEVLNSGDVFEKIKAFKACQKILHQAEMLNPVHLLVISVNPMGQFYIMSNDPTPQAAVYLMEEAKKRLL